MLSVSVIQIHFYLVDKNSQHRYFQYAWYNRWPNDQFDLTIDDQSIPVVHKQYYENPNIFKVSAVMDSV